MSILNDLLTYDSLTRLSVFALLGFIFWSLSLYFPMNGYRTQRIRIFDGIFIFAALLMAGLAEEFLLPSVRFITDSVQLVLQFVALQDITLTAPVKLFCYLICVDFCSYWLHRLMHSHVFWSCHAFHHSPKAINWLSGARGSPLHMAFIVLPGLLFSNLFFIDDSAIIFYIIILIEISSQHLTHTNLKLPFERKLEWFLVTPRMHFIHHNHNKTYGDTNFGSYFSIWDHVFGTYTDPSTVPNKECLGLDREYTMSSLMLGVRLVEAENKDLL